MIIWAVYAIDAWADPDGGWQQNDYYQQALYIQAKEYPTNERIIRALKKAGMLGKRYRYDAIDVMPDRIDVEYHRTGEPLLSLRETEESTDSTFFLTRTLASVYRIGPKRIRKIQ